MRYAIFMVTYGFLRFFVEFLRDTPKDGSVLDTDVVRRHQLICRQARSAAENERLKKAVFRRKIICIRGTVRSAPEL